MKRILLIGLSFILISCKTDPTSATTDPTPATADTTSSAKDTSLFDLPHNVGSKNEYNYSFHNAIKSDNSHIIAKETIIWGYDTWVLLSTETVQSNRFLTFSTNRADTVWLREWQEVNDSTLNRSSILVLDTTYFEIIRDTIVATITPDSIYFPWRENCNQIVYSTFNTFRRTHDDTITVKDTYSNYTAIYANGKGLVYYSFHLSGTSSGISESLTLR